MPAGSLSELRVRMSGIPGSDVTVTVYKNGSATSVTCSVVGGVSASCSEVVETVDFAADDLLAVLVSSSGENKLVSLSMKFAAQ
jgi:hypothetical protein